MTFKEYEIACMKGIIYPGRGETMGVIYATTGLAGEAGEVANKITKFIRDGGQLDTDSLKKELGDVLWYIAAMARELEIDLEDIAITNVDKIQSRLARGKIGGSGDDR